MTSRRGFVQSALQRAAQRRSALLCVSKHSKKHRGMNKTQGINSSVGVTVAAGNESARSPAATESISTPPIDPLLKLDRTLSLVGVSRTTWLDAVRAGDAPAPYRVYGKAVAWKQSEISAFINSRPRATRAGAEK